MEKHIELLKQIPADCFYYSRDIIDRIKRNEPIKNPNCVAYCYYDLGMSMQKDDLDRIYRVSCGMWSRRTPYVEEKGDFYTFCDTAIKFPYNIDKPVSKQSFSLPKMYKQALYNKKPSNVAVFCQPKEKGGFKQVACLQHAFITCTSREEHRTDPIYMQTCYDALKKLTEKAELKYNEKLGTCQGSIVLTEELATLLSNQNIILNTQKTFKHYSQILRMHIIEAHKKKMFGELQR